MTIISKGILSTLRVFLVRYFVFLLKGGKVIKKMKFSRVFNRKAHKYVVFKT